MSDQVWGCDVLGSSACPRAESGIKLDIVGVGKQIHEQDLVSRDKEPTPSPMEVSGIQENEGNVLSKMGQSAQKGVSDRLLIIGPSEHVHPEVTNPHKPLKLAQAYEDNYVQRPDQGITKAQTGRGKIKKLARELGQTQGKDFKTKNFILGTKRLGSQNFPECEEKVARKKKCVGVIGNSSDEHLSAVAAVQHRREP